MSKTTNKFSPEVRERAVRMVASSVGQPPQRSVGCRFSCAALRVTYVHAWAGFVYVAFVIDAFARRIVGWKVCTSATAGFVLDALELAIHARRPAPDDGLIHHSDRGVQYLAMNYTQRLAEAKLVPSVVASATATTTPWPRRSTAFTRPRSVTVAMGSKALASSASTIQPAGFFTNSPTTYLQW